MPAPNTNKCSICGKTAFCLYDFGGQFAAVRRHTPLCYDCMSMMDNRDIELLEKGAKSERKRIAEGSKVAASTGNEIDWVKHLCKENA